MQRGKHYLKSAAECTSKAIVSLELSDKNINTAKQAIRLESIGPETVRRLEGYVNTQVYSSDRPAPGRFVSSAGAMLVALLHLTELAAADSQGGVVLIPEEQLRTEAAKLCDEKFLPSHSPGFCQAWWRLEVLIKRDLVKRRSLHKANVYHLLPLGMDVALTLRERSLGHEPTTAGVKKAPSASATSASSSSPSSSTVSTPAKPRKQKAIIESPSSGIKSAHLSLPKAAAVSSSSTSFVSSPVLSAGPLSRSAGDPVNHVVTDAMYSNDRGQDGVILLVDIQEGGGNRAGLADLCEMIEQTGTVYRTRKLRCADYNWLWRCDGVERQLPFLLERKRADDVAHSLKDGRFWGQIDKMTSVKEEFQKKGVQTVLQYVVEGKPESFVARCADGCQGVGRCGNPSLQQVQRVLCDLKQHPHLELVAMDSMLDTVRHLAKITSQLHDRAKRGEFDALVIAEMTAASPHEARILEETKPETVLILSDDDDGDDSAESTSCQKKDLSSDDTLPATHGFKDSHSSLPVCEGYDELPPLVLPRSVERRPLDLNKESGSVGQAAKQTCGVSPVPLTTPSGSPRGRVYLMKRKGDKFGHQISPNKKARGCEDSDRAVTGRTTTAAGSELGAGRHTDKAVSSIGDRERLGDSLTRTRPRHAVSEPQLHNTRSESPTTGVSSGHWEGSQRSPKPSVCAALSNKPTALENMPSGFLRSDSHVSPPKTASHPSHCHRDLCVEEGAAISADSLSASGTFRLKQDAKEHSTQCSSDDNAVRGDKNDRDGSAAGRSEAQCFMTHSVTSALSPGAIDPTDSKSMTHSIVSIKPGPVSPVVSSLSEEKDVIGTRCGDHDGSDSDSLPDIDLGMGPAGHPSQTISSSASPHHLPATREDQEKGITLWPRGNNSQEKKNRAAPRPGQTADTLVHSADKIAQIAVVFPQMRGSQIAEVLHRFDGDVERCVIGILEDPGLVGV
ncbi:uncharacterized protein LOC143294275 [Babylonia areolata]|uniref:uncharacterized protein LOC143294275 n=1 Tax=Babylonia areolata TaxID=304850 RepID=UPI003FCF222D